ncbi:tRNA (guanosine(37)-N1)-methyltransferase TrmD [Alteromonas sp. a30]|uniref:tRNA (guanosine(37)-N1)-methyltransferase TrmD n=1 Tax=Alteromonas sp. a30 TaxID=2730917 RepID=UPI0022816566|nr:tRNA (guanosine(37)-N1)-methyltransferase TrmD [Alteromonas sp. a30]MCY7295854.1 tRNA (guanosine(37)-N1)-methyltransferase TrmD [Alteromonas sp. a30]
MTSSYWFGLVTLFPEMFTAFTEQGVSGRAVQKGLIDVECFNPRDFTHDKHRTVDDRPYGGGPGMLMMVQPLSDAIDAAKTASNHRAKVVYMSPQGQPLTQQIAQDLANENALILVAGRYEGIDERVIQSHVDMEISVGDYVLSGGELPAMVLMDAVSRLVPGVLGHADSAVEDSFNNGLLDCPHYTRPEILNGEPVPKVLLSGNHEKIRQWRLQQSLGRTWLRRPELLNFLALTEEQKRLLEAFKQTHLQQNKHDS